MKPEHFNIKRAVHDAAFEMGVMLHGDQLKEFTKRVLSRYSLHQETLPPYIIERLKPLTYRHKAVAQVIFEGIRDTGISPTLREIVQKTDITSTFVANYHVDDLIYNKIVEKNKNFKHRSLRIAQW